jgi:hypothetical protein
LGPATTTASWVMNLRGLTWSNVWLSLFQFPMVFVLQLKKSMCSCCQCNVFVALVVLLYFVCQPFRVLRNICQRIKPPSKMVPSMQWICFTKYPFRTHIQKKNHLKHTMIY